MTETYDLVVFWLVVAARFLVPLLIPRYPLPGILVVLLIDAADQTVFQQFTKACCCPSWVGPSALAARCSLCFS